MQSFVILAIFCNRAGQFVLLLWIFYVFVLSCVCFVLCASVYMCFVVTCWERADLLALVCGVFCEFVTFPLVSWVRCGTWLYRFLIFAPLLTLTWSVNLKTGFLATRSIWLKTYFCLARNVLGAGLFSAIEAQACTFQTIITLGADTILVYSLSEWDVWVDIVRALTKACANWEGDRGSEPPSGKSKVTIGFIGKTDLWTPL